MGAMNADVGRVPRGEAPFPTAQPVYPPRGGHDGLDDPTAIGGSHALLPEFCRD
jgi:hypothetical protein